LLRNADERHALEAAARKLVVEQYDWSVAARHLEDALIDVGRGAATAAGSPVPRDLGPSDVHAANSAHP
jgi:hypothetical protein